MQEVNEGILKSTAKKNLNFLKFKAGSDSTPMVINKNSL